MTKGQRRPGECRLGHIWGALVLNSEPIDMAKQQELV
jgi:hypothetical protein